MGDIRVRFSIVGKGFLETFKDENVNYVKKVQDFAKIDTSFTDFSLTFSIPATVENFDKLDYYNDPSFIGVLDPKSDIVMEMFINQTKIATGTMKLLSIGRVNRKSRNITIQFFADATNLSFALRSPDGNKVKLKLLANNWAGYEHSITAIKIGDYLQGNPVLNTSAVDTGLKYPMASQDNRWLSKGTQNYEGIRRISDIPNLTANDIGILNTEVRPAIKASVIIDEIFKYAGSNTPRLGKYKVMFDTRSYYTDLWMWIANGIIFDNVGANTRVNNTVYTVGNQVNLAANIWETPIFTTQTSDTFGLYNPVTNIYTASVDSNYYFKIVLYDYPIPSLQGGISMRYRINGGSWIFGGNTGNNVVGPIAILAGDTLEFQVFSSIVSTNINSPSYIQIYSDPYQNQITINPTMWMPDITAEDYLLGILNTFNAVMYWDNDYLNSDGTYGAFIIDHKYSWFNSGKEVNLTDAVDTSKDTILPPVFFRSYKMGWKEANDFMSIEYDESETDSIPYASDFYNTGYKYGIDYEFQNPFTATVWQSLAELNSDGDILSVTNIPSFQCVEPEGDSVDPGCRHMYFNGVVATTGGYYYNTADALNLEPTQRTAFNNFSFHNEAENIVFSYTSLADWQITIPLNQPEFNISLYDMFYSEQVVKSYNATTRRYKLSTYLEFADLNDIKLNDTIIIGLNKFYINSMSVNYLTGKVDFELIDWLDFSQIP